MADAAAVEEAAKYTDSAHRAIQHVLFASTAILVQVVVVAGLLSPAREQNAAEANAASANASTSRNCASSPPALQGAGPTPPVGVQEAGSFLEVYI